MSFSFEHMALVHLGMARTARAESQVARQCGDISRAERLDRIARESERRGRRLAARLTDAPGFPPRYDP